MENEAVLASRRFSNCIHLNREFALLKKLARGHFSFQSPISKNPTTDREIEPHFSSPDIEAVAEAIRVRIGVEMLCFKAQIVDEASTEDPQLPARNQVVKLIFQTVARGDPEPHACKFNDETRENRDSPLGIEKPWFLERSKASNCTN